MLLLTILNAIESNYAIEYLEYISSANINLLKKGNHPVLYKRDYLGVEHEDEFVLSFNAFNTTVAVHLKPSENSRDIKVTTGSQDSEEWIKPKLFSGRVIDYHSNGVGLDHDSSATAATFLFQDNSFVSNHQDKQFEMATFEGKIRLNGDTFHVHTIDNYNKLRKRTDAIVSDPLGRADHEKNAQLIIYKSSDVGRGQIEEYTCGVTDEHEMPEELREMQKMRLNKRAFSVATGCPGSVKELYMGVVMDCTYIAKFGGREGARSQLLQQMDFVNILYKHDFNIVLGIIEIVEMDTCSTPSFNVGCSNSYTINSRLSDFSEWRADNKDSTAGLWHLVSVCKTDPVIGLAWMSSVCTTSKTSKQDNSGATQYYSGTSISTPSSQNNDWVIIAHEIGHNFASKHDCTKTDICSGLSDNSCCECTTGTSCDCGGSFIMNPSSGTYVPQDFSSCSKNLICSKIPTLATCLQEPGQKPLLNLKVCGNGILEGDEECDNGSNPSTCCKNCTLVAPAKCDDYSHSCCTNCTIATPDKVCRPSVGPCDIVDTCDGQHADCPPTDKFEPDGLKCTSGLNKDTYCASGQCTNRDMQCILHEVSGLSDAIRDWDPITGSCSLFKGQCDLWCDSAKLPCRKLSGSFLPGTKCGSGNGYCTASNECTDPDNGSFYSFSGQSMGIYSE